MLMHSACIMAGCHTARAGITRLSGRHVIIETERPQSFHLDGELNRATPITCTVEPGALRILSPQGAPTDLFERPGVALERGVMRDP